MAKSHGGARSSMTCSRPPHSPLSSAAPDTPSAVHLIPGDHLFDAFMAVPFLILGGDTVIIALLLLIAVRKSGHWSLCEILCTAVRSFCFLTSPLSFSIWQFQLGIWWLEVLVSYSYLFSVPFLTSGWGCSRGFNLDLSHQPGTSSCPAFWQLQSFSPVHPLLLCIKVSIFILSKWHPCVLSEILVRWISELLSQSLWAHR